MTGGSENINIIPQPEKTVLVAPLDWGLGHAARCIPIIRELLVQGFRVIAAAEGKTALLIGSEFPGLKILPLTGYRVTYAKKRKMFFWHMLSQGPKIRAAVNREHAWLQESITRYHINIVISDNRFGLYSHEAHCIFLTHQVNIKAGGAVLSAFASRINRTFIKKFHACWIPDYAGKDSLAGQLSNLPVSLKLPVTYIGPLSRMSAGAAAKTLDLAIVLSGPEPQRTIFENILVKELNTTALRVAVVRGLPGATALPKSGSVKFFNHLAAAELNTLMLSAKLIVARSGYSTVMDLAALQQRAVLVPTPGQGEQEYLAAYLSGKKYCCVAVQEGFSLATEVQKASAFDYIPWPVPDATALPAAIRKLQ